MNIVLPLGVQGDSETLHLFLSRVPREAWLNINSAYAAGSQRCPRQLLAARRRRQPDRPRAEEVPLVTSDDALQNLPPGIDGEDSYVIADEVRSLNFQYFDGTNWQDTWDSTVPGNDGVTPIGSPVAIAVTIDIARPGSNGAVKTYRHVIAVPTANGGRCKPPRGRCLCRLSPPREAASRRNAMLRPSHFDLRSRRGVVLIAVLLIVVVLSLAAYQYSEWITADTAPPTAIRLGSDACVCGVRRQLYRCHDKQFGCVYEHAQRQSVLQPCCFSERSGPGQRFGPPRHVYYPEPPFAR